MNKTTAQKKAQAIIEIEELVKGGSKVRAAVESVAYRTGFGERSLYTFLQKTKGVARDERLIKLERKPTVPRPRVVCHPDALKRFIDLCRGGRVITECFRQMEAEAKANGWAPIPSERTLRRELDKQTSWTERFELCPKVGDGVIRRL